MNDLIELTNTLEQRITIDRRRVFAVNEIIDLIDEKHPVLKRNGGDIVKPGCLLLIASAGTWTAVLEDYELVKKKVWGDQV